MIEKNQFICNDPLFQLNLAIWLAQPMPDSSFINPILYRSGFKIYLIGPVLSLPPDIRLTTGDLAGKLQASAKPEIIFESENKQKLLIMECKKSSFGKSSSTAHQARTLLVLSGSIVSEVLAIGARESSQGILCYLTKSEQKLQLEDTLAELSKEVKDLMNYDTGISGCFGIELNNSSLLLDYSDQLQSVLRLQSTRPIEIANFDGESDFHLLYFIPYDPSIEQTPEEQAFCRRILYERILSYILCKVGPSIPPKEIIIAKEDVMREVTFGLYDLWDDVDSKKYMRNLLKEMMLDLRNFLKEAQRHCLEYEERKGWVIKLKDNDEYEEILMQITKFKPENLDLSKQIDSDQLELF